MGVRAEAGRARCSSSPTSTSAATPRCSRWASRSTTAWCGTRTSRTAGSPPSSSATRKVILWKGHCSVHGRFSPDVVDELRATIPGINILVHPECQHEVVLKADLVGSTEFIIKTIEAAPAGSAGRSAPSSTWSSGSPTPHPDKRIVFLDNNVCYCSTMNRIDLPALRVGDGVAGRGRVVNRIEVDPDTERGRAGRPAADARPARQVPPRLTSSAGVLLEPDAARAAAAFHWESQLDHDSPDSRTMSTSGSRTPAAGACARAAAGPPDPGGRRGDGHRLRVSGPRSAASHNHRLAARH